MDRGMHVYRGMQVYRGVQCTEVCSGQRHAERHAVWLLPLSCCGRVKAIPREWAKRLVAARPLVGRRRRVPPAQ